MCPETFEPVCASDGETYMNECKMKKDACSSHNYELVVVEHEACDDSSGSGGKKYCQVEYLFKL